MSELPDPLPPRPKSKLPRNLLIACVLLLCVALASFALGIYAMVSGFESMAESDATPKPSELANRIYFTQIGFFAAAGTGVLGVGCGIASAAVYLGSRER